MGNPGETYFFNDVQDTFSIKNDQELRNNLDAGKAQWLRLYELNNNSNSK